MRDVLVWRHAQQCMVARCRSARPRRLIIEDIAQARTICGAHPSRGGVHTNFESVIIWLRGHTYIHKREYVAEYVRTKQQRRFVFSSVNYSNKSMRRLVAATGCLWSQVPAFVHRIFVFISLAHAVRMHLMPSTAINRSSVTIHRIIEHNPNRAPGVRRV